MNSEFAQLSSEFTFYNKIITKRSFQDKPLYTDNQQSHWSPNHGAYFLDWIISPSNTPLREELRVGIHCPFKRIYLFWLNWLTILQLLYLILCSFWHKHSCCLDLYSGFTPATLFTVAISGKCSHSSLYSNKKKFSYLKQ